MATYILRISTTSRGRRMILDDPNVILNTEDEMNITDARIIGLYAVLGDIDFVAILDADDNAAAARFALELGVRAGLNIETLPALPVGVLSDEEHISLLRDAAVAMNLPTGPDEAVESDDWRIPDEPD